jgi:hypothetical protein
MSSQAVRKFQKKYRQHYSDYVNWPLTRQVSVGDIGKWSSGKTFAYEENLSKYGVSLATRSGATIASRAFTSAAGVGIQFKAAGDIPPAKTALVKAKAGVSIALDSNASCVLRARNLREETVADKAALEEALSKLGKPPDWWSHRVVISSVVRADLATVALAHSSKQRVDINADIGTEVPFEIVDATLGLQIGYQGSDTSVDLLAKDVVIAFQISKLRNGRRWYHSWVRQDPYPRRLAA